MTKHIHGEVDYPSVVGVGNPVSSLTIAGRSDTGSKKRVYLRVPIEHVPGLIEHLQRFMRARNYPEGTSDGG